MQLVDQDTFLKQLTELFQKSQERGSVWLTHKRLTRDGEDTEMTAAGDEDKAYACLIRATNGKDINFSTRVQSGELGKFNSAYGALLKASMTTLRKRDKKREKQRAEESARRKQRLIEEVEIEGAKRGNGRRKRQRKVKAALKQEEAKRRLKEREESKAKVKST